MKKTYTLICLLAAFGFFYQTALAQCMPDTNYTSPGVYPDPLPDGCVGTPYSEVVNVVFPNDTTINMPPFPPFTVPFDSFVLSSITGIPAGLSYQCNQPNCTYITNPPNITRACVLISGTPTAPTNPGDSITVVGDAWVTVSGSAQKFTETYKIALDVYAAGTGPCAPASIDKSFSKDHAFTIYPNPVSKGATMKVALGTADHLEISVHAVTGAPVNKIPFKLNTSGSEEIVLDKYIEGLKPGIYFVRILAENSGRVETLRLVKIQ